MMGSPRPSRRRRLYLPEMTLTGPGITQRVCALHDLVRRKSASRTMKRQHDGGGAGDHPQQTADQTDDRVAAVGRIPVAGCGVSLEHDRGQRAADGVADIAQYLVEARRAAGLGRWEPARCRRTPVCRRVRLAAHHGGQSPAWAATSSAYVGEWAVSPPSTWVVM